MENTHTKAGIVASYQDAMWDVESLTEFYSRSSQTLEEYRCATERDYSPGKKLADIFDEVLECQGAEARNARIEELMQKVIIDGVKLCDLCEIIPFSEDNHTLRFSLKEPYRQAKKYRPSEAKKHYDHIAKYEYILVESVLSHIIVSFENFLSEIYRILLLKNPLRYFENQTILLADVFGDGFDEAIKEKLDNEIDSKMRNSLDALKIISTKEEIDIDRYENITEHFTEVYYRRNAYVHTLGLVNKDYLKKVNQRYTSEKTEGDELVCDKKYIEDAIVSLEKMMFSIVYELLVKLNADDAELNVVSDYLFEKLKNKEYSLTKFTYYALSQYKSLQFIDRTRYRINYIIATKQLHEKKIVEKEIKALDVSIATDDFKIAKECLCDNNEQVYKLLSDTYPKTFDAVAIREWPIFIDFRETSFYSDFVDQHKEDFEIQQIEPIVCVSSESLIGTEETAAV